MHIAILSVEISRSLREQGVEIPVGDGSDDDILTMCGVQAFEWVCNAYMDNLAMQVTVKKNPRPPTYDKQARPIPHGLWMDYQQRGEEYKRVALWRSENNRECVSTIWTGIDPNGCEPPHIFQTLAFRFEGSEPKAVRTFPTHNIYEAMAAHQQVVALMQRGKL